MIEILLDASQLEYFEPCPRKWAYSHLWNIEPNNHNPALDDGSYWHDILATYYKFKQANPTMPLDRTMKVAADRMKDKELLEKYYINQDKLRFFIRRFTEYCYNHFSEDEQMEVIAVEQGFSWILYEDADRRYILEGRIDLVCRYAKKLIFVVDHKTQSRFYEKWPLNHQVMNYLSISKADYFMYNYIGLQDKASDNSFHRPIFKPPKDMIDQWKKEVKKTFDEMYNYKIDELEHRPSNMDSNVSYINIDSYPRRRSACTTQYGVCAFHKICGLPDGSKWFPAILTHYKEKDETWRAWS